MLTLLTVMPSTSLVGQWMISRKKQPFCCLHDTVWSNGRLESFVAARAKAASGPGPPWQSSIGSIVYLSLFLHRWSVGHLYRCFRWAQRPPVIQKNLIFAPSHFVHALLHMLYFQIPSRPDIRPPTSRCMYNSRPSCTSTTFKFSGSEDIAGTPCQHRQWKHCKHARLNPPKIPACFQSHNTLPHFTREPNYS